MDLQIKSSLNSAKILNFRKQAGKLLVQLLHHFLEKSPLKYAIVRSFVWPNPVYIRNSTKMSSFKSHMDILLQKLVHLGRISGRSAESVKKQFQNVFIVIDQSQLLF